MDNFNSGEIEDLATLSKLDDKVLLEELKVRYTKDKIYVSFISALYITSLLVLL